MHDNGPFRVEKDGHIAWLVLNRPEKRNTVDLEFIDGFIHLFQEFEEDNDIRVIIIKGEGKSFTAGLDLMKAESTLQGGGADTREAMKKNIKKFQEGVNVIEKCAKPVIAAVHSHCIGAGIDLISACDIRLASRDALFSIRETRIAIIADMGTLQRLPYIIGHGWFRELALTGRDFNAEEALKMGFITHLLEDKEALYKKAGEVAYEIASCAPLTVQGTKEVILYTRDQGVYPGLEYVAQKNAAVLPSEDLKEAIQAFMEKRPPKFKGK